PGAGAGGGRAGGGRPGQAAGSVARAREPERRHRPVAPRAATRTAGCRASLAGRASRSGIAAARARAARRRAARAGAPAAPAPAPIQEKEALGVPAVQHMVFGADLIEGTVRGPDGEIVRLIRPAPQPSLIELRRDFVPEMVKSLEEL